MSYGRDSLNLADHTYVLCEQQDWFEYEISFLRRLLQPGQRAIDVGANYGVYTLSIARAVGPTGAVWASSPPQPLPPFSRRGSRPNGFTQVVLERSALSRECGTAQLTLHDESRTECFNSSRTQARSETVRVVSLDDCLQRYGWRQIDFLKIDAEGEEANIIEGGRRFLEELSPLILYEVKAAKDIHLELVDTFAALGFNSIDWSPGSTCWCHSTRAKSQTITCSTCFAARRIERSALRKRPAPRFCLHAIGRG